MHSKAMQSLRLWTIVYAMMDAVGGRSKVE